MYDFGSIFKRGALLPNVKTQMLPSELNFISIFLRRLRGP